MDFVTFPKQSLVSPSVSSTEELPLKKSTIAKMTESVFSTGHAKELPVSLNLLFTSHAIDPLALTVIMLQDVEY